MSSCTKRKILFIESVLYGKNFSQAFFRAVAGFAWRFSYRDMEKKRIFVDDMRFTLYAAYGLAFMKSIGFCEFSRLPERLQSCAIVHSKALGMGYLSGKSLLEAGDQGGRPVPLGSVTRETAKRRQITPPIMTEL